MSSEVLRLGHRSREGFAGVEKEVRKKARGPWSSPRDTAMLRQRLLIPAAPNSTVSRRLGGSSASSPLGLLASP
jgi:hypothetical protein